jgi:hypothetical protein
LNCPWGPVQLVLTRKFRRENPSSTGLEVGSAGVWSERFTVEVEVQLQLRKLYCSWKSSTTVEEVQLSWKSSTAAEEAQLSWKSSTISEEAQLLFNMNTLSFSILTTVRHRVSKGFCFFWNSFWI